MRSLAARSAAVLGLCGLAASQSPDTSVLSYVPHGPVSVARNGSSVALRSRESWFFGSSELTYANLTSWNYGNSSRVTADHNFGNLLKNTACPSNSSSVSMTFNSQQAYANAKNSWNWVNVFSSREIFMTISEPSCIVIDSEMQPYKISSITWIDETFTAQLNGANKNWTDIFGANTTISYRGNGQPNSALSKRDSGTISVGHDFSGTDLISTTVDGVTLDAKCSSCQTYGKVSFDFDLSWESLSGSVSVSSDGGFGASIDLDFSASGSLTQSYNPDPINILSTSLPGGFSISGIASFGPHIIVQAQPSISGVTASVDASFGVNASFSGTLASVGYGSGGNGESFSSSFGFIQPAISASVDFTASIGPIIILDISATVFGTGLTTGVKISGPEAIVTVNAEASSNGGACDNSDADISFELDVGASAGAFFGEGGDGDTPNLVNFASTTTQVYSACVAATGTPSSSGSGSSGSGSGSGVVIEACRGQQSTCYYSPDTFTIPASTCYSYGLTGGWTVASGTNGYSCNVFESDSSCSSGGQSFGFGVATSFSDANYFRCDPIEDAMINVCVGELSSCGNGNGGNPNSLGPIPLNTCYPYELYGNGVTWTLTTATPGITCTAFFDTTGSGCSSGGQEFAYGDATSFENANLFQCVLTA